MYDLSPGTFHIRFQRCSLSHEQIRFVTAVVAACCFRGFCHGSSSFSLSSVFSFFGPWLFLTFARPHRYYGLC